MVGEGVLSFISSQEMHLKLYRWKIYEALANQLGVLKKSVWKTGGMLEF